ncbi:MAG: T9SS type A sorting domain-containing protein [Gemmatimonadetes bacterium]|nr:T9SS type A sorting domain-containing protein [Gemmatimonadota bacterium]
MIRNVLLTLAILTAGAATALAPPCTAQITAERIATGLTAPVYATHAPGDASRMFILEQPGVVRLMKDKSLQTAPFLDITSIVNGGGEQGLLGLAFHPQYQSNGYFYVYFIMGSGAGNSVIRRYSVTSDPDSADAASGTPVFSIPQPFTNHNAGHIAFGSDGYLYFGLGDGGSANDPSDRAQNGLDLMGSLCRIDVDGADAYPGDPNNNYAIPPTNPFVGSPSFLDEIWAYGLRNPYRWSFDRLTGDLWIGDVGQDCFEEISFAPGTSTGGENYSWDIMEGPDCFNEMPFSCNQGPCGSGLVDPIFSIAHSGVIAITGGYVYRGSRIPAIYGEYFFAEFYSGTIQSIRRTGAGLALADTTDWTAALDPPTSNINSIAGFAEDLNGELYILDAGGEMFQIVPESTDAPVVNPPAGFAIEPATPNPFRDITRFDIRLESAGALRAAMYNASGRLVRVLHDGPAPAGVLPVSWTGYDARGETAPAGVYFLRVTGGDRTASARVVLLR